MDSGKTENKDVQKLKDGAGDTFHRTYGVDLPCTMQEARTAMTKLQTDPNHFSPQLLATFEKTKGEGLNLRTGDEFMIHISGPWNGPVRVADVNKDSFTLSTLDGHLEAGKIQFRVCEKDGTVRFEIESLARSKDSLVDFFYDKVPIARFAQTKMWQAFCATFKETASEISSSQSEVDVETERRKEKTGEWKRE